MCRVDYMGLYTRLHAAQHQEGIRIRWQFEQAERQGQAMQSATGLGQSEQQAQSCQNHRPITESESP
jgi:hypothetical protein